MLFGTATLASAQDNVAQGLDISAERERIKAERSQMEAEYSQSLRACYQKLNVNSCKDDAFKIRLQKTNMLRAQERVLNDQDRKQRGAAALQSIEEKNSLEAQTEDAERRARSAQQHLDKLESNLEKNEELKSVLLQETPWVMEAKSEAAQKRNIALLFDLYKLGKEKQISLAKLKDMVTDNGGFSWFKGGRDDRFITQYILTGIGHLKKLNALSDADLAELQPLIQKALIYLDARILEEYQSIIQLKKEKNSDQLSYLAIQYGYMRSFFKESPQSNTTKTAVNYYREQSEKYWLKQSRYMQAMIAFTFYMNGNENQAQLIMRSLKVNKRFLYKRL